MMPITDIAVITHDLPRAISFYTEKLGLTLAHRMEGFADFHGLGIALAVWEADHLRATTGVPASTGGHGPAAMIAVRLEAPSEVDQRFDELRRTGVEFHAPPKDYPWNARCVYFIGPDSELWELYAWYDGGEPGAVDTGDRPTSEPL